jgi:hypothetical protein
VAVSGGKWQSVTFQKKYFVSKKRLGPHASQNSMNRNSVNRMIEQLRFRILRLKADKRPEVFLPPCCDASSTKHSNPNQTAHRIPQTLNALQSNFPTRQREHLGGRLITKFLKGK